MWGVYHKILIMKVNIIRLNIKVQVPTPSPSSIFRSELLNPLWLIWTKRIYIKISAFVLKSLYVKCGLKCFRFLFNIKIEKKLIFLLFKKSSEKCKMNFITFYWYHDQVQLMNTYENKNYDHNFIIEDFREKIEFLDIGPFRKMAKTFFSVKDIN